MTTGLRLFLPFATVVYDSTGVPIPGALFFFYASGTSTPLNTYADAGLTVPNANPVQANAAGMFPNIFMQPVNYKLVLTDSLFNQIWTADPVAGVGSAPPNQRSISGSGSLPILLSDNILNIGISAPLTIAVPLAIGRGGSILTFKNLASSTAVATIVPTAPDEFDTLTSVPLSPGASITIIPANDGVNSGYEIS